MAHNNSAQPSHNKIGIALGGGAARGWAHIGILNALAQRDIIPDIVCGSSIGALVGGAYASGHLGQLEDWVKTLRRRNIAALLDVTIRGGGLIQGEKLMAIFKDHLGDIAIENLDKPYAAVVTELATGKEVWIQSGSLSDAVRASMAVPGLFTPHWYHDKWLFDGGLVNPVPVSVCRALGAEFVIAVNLNDKLVGKSFRNEQSSSPDHPKKEETNESGGLESLTGEVKDWANSLWSNMLRNHKNTPGLFDVMINAVYIMQDRITQSRLADDPPDVLLCPQMAEMSMMEFDRAEEAIAEGIACVERMAPILEKALEGHLH